MKRVWYRGLLPVLWSAFVIYLWAGPVCAALVQPAEVESGSVIVTAETAEVREGPSPDFGVITYVGKGEIFPALGRTGAWYFIKINENASGWISGRAVGRYQAEGSPPPYVVPYEERYYPNYPGNYYDYPFFWWGQPFFSWEWYFYGPEPHRDRIWDHGRDYPRDRDRDWPPGGDWHGDGNRPPGGDRGRPNPLPFPPVPKVRPPGPFIRPPFPHK